MKHPTVIAAVILGVSIALSAVLVSICLCTVARAITDKPVGGTVFPSTLKLESGSGEAVNVRVENLGATPLHVGP